jgi:hypothetical protein
VTVLAVVVAASRRRCSSWSCSTFQLELLDPDPNHLMTGDHPGLWCSGCGQPYLPSADGWLYPVPITDPSHWAMPYTAVHQVDLSNVGGELSFPWPHALWTAQSDPNQSHGYRLPAIYNQSRTYCGCEPHGSVTSTAGGNRGDGPLEQENTHWRVPAGKDRCAAIPGSDAPRLGGTRRLH